MSARAVWPRIVPLVVFLAACGGGEDGFGAVRTIAEAGASNPTVAVDPERGHTYVTWIDASEGPSDVWLRSAGSDGTIGETVRVNDVPGDAAPHAQAPAQVAVGPDGSVYVAWTNATPMEGRRFPSSNLRFARSTDGGRTFEPAITVNDDTAGVPSSHHFHNLAVAPDGSIVVSWLDSRRDWNPDGVKGAHAHAGPTFDPELPGPDVRIAISRDGGRSFEPSRIVDQQTCPCCRTAMAIGPDGTIYLSWRKIFEGDVRDVVVSTSTDGGRTFGAPERVASDDWVFPGCPHAGPALTVDPEGTLHVAWYTGRESGPGLYYTSSSDRGRTFESATPLLTGEWVPPSQATLAASGTGRLWVAWEDRRPAVPEFRVVSTEVGRPLDLDGGTAFPGTNPVLSTAGGRTSLAWLNGDRVLYRDGPVGR